MQDQIIDNPEHIAILNITDRSLASAEVSKFNDEVWYFNRIIVPPAIRNRGIAKKLMEQLIKVLDKRKITLVCDINPYGDLDFDQLKVFYKKYGFVDHDVHHLIRYAK